MRNFFYIPIAVCLFSFAGALSAISAQEMLSTTHREIPGAKATYLLNFSAPGAKGVEIAGIWDTWSVRHPLRRTGTHWQFDLRALTLSEGQYHFKFIIDGQWEEGANRMMFISPEGMAERPPALIRSAVLREPTLLQIELAQPVSRNAKVDVEVVPSVAIKRKGLTGERANGYLSGSFVKNGQLTFVLNPEVYGLQLNLGAKVVVAGTFNDWDGTGKHPRWRLHPRQGGKLWSVTIPVAGFPRSQKGEDILFKFVVNGSQWLAPPINAPNRKVDSSGNGNLHLASLDGGLRYILVELEEPLALKNPYQVEVSGLWKRPLLQAIDSKPVLDTLTTDKAMGVTRRNAPNVATYRVFSPRASRVDLLLYDEPFAVDKKGKKVSPSEVYSMWQDKTDGVWEVSLVGWDLGRSYAFRVHGPEGIGEGFREDAIVGDPYAHAVAHAENLPVLVDLEATNRWFGGWTDQDFVAPAHEDFVVYETHVRDLTIHPSSPVRPPFKGNYEGILKSLGSGTGLDHLKELGVNTIEFLPIHEFNNGPEGHNWGYTTVYFFAPEASYAIDPLNGSQVYEFKRLVNELHNQGFAVMLDVVYNHVGHPNLFSDLDRKYYFRLKPDYTFQNFSGVGNDVRTEAPMMRKLIVDSILFWMKEYKIDGFRFDLAELIDMETLAEIQREAIKVNPNVLLVSEPWSFRGTHKHKLKGTGWSAWNDDFRYRIKEFAHGNADRESVKKVIEGSTRLWTDSPLQSVNYVESHDDMALVDELSMRPDKNAKNLTAQDAQGVRLAGTVVFTSLGIPMIHEGQEYARSKLGISNTYNKGDAVNALDWKERDRPLAKETLEYTKGLIALRKSPQGASFRVRNTPEDYFRWIEPADGRAVGFVINEHGKHPGKTFAVLLNSSSRDVNFQFDLPAGEWVQVSDGTRIDLMGLPSARVASGPNHVRIPRVSSAIFMRK